MFSFNPKEEFKIKNTTCKIIIIIGVIIFFLQSLIVYFDKTGRQFQPLSNRAYKGQALWLENNCQSCHQIYGFGGFLGGDLTNLYSRVSIKYLNQILIKGQMQMPAFHFSKQDRLSIIEYLKEIDKTGIGQPRFNDSVQTQNVTTTLLENIIYSKRNTSKTDQGYNLMQQHGCFTCHLNRSSNQPPPDLSLVVQKYDNKMITKIITQGINGRMPSFKLSNKELNEIVNFLHFWNKNKVVLQKKLRQIDANSRNQQNNLPWFEYK